MNRAVVQTVFNKGKIINNIQTKAFKTITRCHTRVYEAEATWRIYNGSSFIVGPNFFGLTLPIFIINFSFLISSPSPLLLKLTNDNYAIIRVSQEAEMSN